MKFPQIFAALRKPEPTSAELRAALAGIDVPAAEAAVDALEAQRRKLLLQDGADLDEIEARIKEANRTVERLAAARDELQAKVPVAEARELANEVSRRGKRAAELRDELRAMYLAVDQTASSLAKQLGELQAKRTELRGCNSFTAQHGELGLKANDPLGELAISMGRPVDSIADFAAWRFSPYWPVQLGTSPLARLAELLPPATARRAA